MFVLQVCEHMTHPLMGMVSELMRRQSELVHLLQRKDKEIDDYKAQGAKVTRSKSPHTIDMMYFESNSYSRYKSV